MSNPQRRVTAIIERWEQEHNRIAHDEVRAQATEAVGDLRDGDSWGPWTWNEDREELEYRGPGHESAPYRLPVGDMLRCEKPAKRHELAWRVLTVIICWKGFGPPAIRYFVFALDEVLGQRGGTP